MTIIRILMSSVETLWATLTRTSSRQPGLPFRRAGTHTLTSIHCGISQPISEALQAAALERMGRTFILHS